MNGSHVKTTTNSQPERMMRSTSIKMGAGDEEDSCMKHGVQSESRKSKLGWISKADNLNATNSREINDRPSIYEKEDGSTRSEDLPTKVHNRSESPGKGKSVRRIRTPSMDFDLAQASTNLMSSRFLRSRSWSMKGELPDFEMDHNLVSGSVNTTVTAADGASHSMVAAKQMVESTPIPESSGRSMEVDSNDSSNATVLSYLAGEIIKAQRAGRNTSAKHSSDRKKKSSGHLMLVGGSQSSRRSRIVADHSVNPLPHGRKDVRVSDSNQEIMARATLPGPPPANASPFNSSNREITNGAGLVSKTVAKYLESRRAGSASKTVAVNRPGSSPPANLPGKKLGATKERTSITVISQGNIPYPTREISETMAKYLESRRKGSNMGSQIVVATGTGPKPFTKMLEDPSSKQGIGRYDHFNAPHAVLAPLNGNDKEDKVSQLESSTPQRGAPSAHLPAENFLVSVPYNPLGLPRSSRSGKKVKEVCLQPQGREATPILPRLSTGQGKFESTASLGRALDVSLARNEFYGSADLDRLDGFLNRLQYWGKFLAQSPEDMFSNSSLGESDSIAPITTSLGRGIAIEGPIQSHLGHSTTAKTDYSKEQTQGDPRFQISSPSVQQRQQIGHLQKALTSQHAKRSKEKNAQPQCGLPITNPLYRPIHEDLNETKQTPPLTLIKSSTDRKRSISLVPYVGKFCSKYGEKKFQKKIISSHAREAEGLVVPYTIISSSELKKSQPFLQFSNRSDVFLDPASTRMEDESTSSKFARGTEDKRQQIIRVESGKTYVRVPSERPTHACPSRLQGLRNLFSGEHGHPYADMKQGRKDWVGLTVDLSDEHICHR